MTPLHQVVSQLSSINSHLKGLPGDKGSHILLISTMQPNWLSERGTSSGSSTNTDYLMPGTAPGVVSALFAPANRPGGKPAHKIKACSSLKKGRAG